MTRRRSILQALAALLSILVFGLMMTAAGRLLLGGPAMQRVRAAWPLEFQLDDEADETSRAEAIGGADSPSDSDMETGATPAEGSVSSMRDERTLGAGDETRSEALADPLLAPSTPPVIEVVKRRISQDPAAIGETVEFSIQLSNTGAVPLTGVYLADSFDAEFLGFVRADPPPSAVDTDAGTITWSELESLLSDGSFDPGENLSIRVLLSAEAATPTGAAAVNRVRAGARENNVSAGPSEDSVRILTPTTLCLGDLVFVEMVDDGRFDASQGDLGLAEVDLSLYADSDASGGLSAGDEPLASTRTDALGHYQFCDLSPGSYIVTVEASNFGNVGPLALLTSSTGGLGIDLGGDPNDDVDGDDNGAPAGPRGVVASAAIELSAGGEPGPSIDGDDATSNRTLDFGFVLLRGESVPAPEPLVDSPDADAPGVDSPGAGSPGVETPRVQGQPPAAEIEGKPRMPRTGRAPGKPVRYEGPIRP